MLIVKSNVVLNNLSHEVNVSQNSTSTNVSLQFLNNSSPSIIINQSSFLFFANASSGVVIAKISSTTTLTFNYSVFSGYINGTNAAGYS